MEEIRENKTGTGEAAREAVPPPEQEQARREKRASAIFWTGTLVLLVFESRPFFMPVTMATFFLLPIFLIVSLLVMAILGIPARHMLRVALNRDRGKGRRIFNAAALAIPFVLLLGYFHSLYVEAARDHRGNDPAVWTRLFYQYEEQLDAVNNTLMNPRGERDWYIAELHAPEDNRIAVTVAQRGSGEILERSLLEESAYLSEEERKTVAALLEGLRVHYTQVKFQHNDYYMYKYKSDIFARFTVGRDKISTPFSGVEENYVEGTWFLAGIEQGQYFDNAPIFYTSFLPDQAALMETV